MSGLPLRPLRSLRAATPLFFFAALLIGLGLFVRTLVIQFQRDQDLRRRADANNSCHIYAVHEGQPGVSQLFTINPVTLTTAPLGSAHPEFDVEGLDFHPQTGELYAVSGRQANSTGSLYTVDPVTGDKTYRGVSDYADLTALGFKSDNTLWSWANGIGLLRLELSRGGKGSIVLDETKQKINALAWAGDGSTLYTVSGSELWQYDLGLRKYAKVADNLNVDTQALATLPDNRLLGSYQTAEGFVLFVYDLASRTVAASHAIKSPYPNVRSLAYDLRCGALVLDGDMAGGNIGATAPDPIVDTLGGNIGASAPDAAAGMTSTTADTAGGNIGGTTQDTTDFQTSAQTESVATPTPTPTATTTLLALNTSGTPTPTPTSSATTETASTPTPSSTTTAGGFGGAPTVTPTPSPTASANDTAGFGGLLADSSAAQTANQINNSKGSASSGGAANITPKPTTLPRAGAVLPSYLFFLTGCLFFSVGVFLVRYKEKERTQ